MDPITNPYSPGAGSPPPELAGRDKLREQVRIAIMRIQRGNSAKSLLMVGLRGVGKTVLLERMRSDAEESGAYTLRIRHLRVARSRPYWHPSFGWCCCG